MKLLRIVSPLAAAILVLGACSLGGGTDVGGRIFLSTSVTENGADRPLVPGTQIRLTFRDGELGASAGCNTIGGTYRLQGDVLVFEGGGMTEMGCDDARHAQDDWLVAFLASRPTLALEGDEMTLTGDGTVIAFLDREVAEPDLPLVGTTWTVDSIITGDAVSSVPGGAVATFAFAGDGRVEVATGCNTGSGRFEATDAGELRFVDVAVTEMACDGPGAELEAAILPLLGGGNLTYAIDSGSLTIMSADAGIALRGS
jgi:heat shock protein HslJ